MRCINCEEGNSPLLGKEILKEGKQHRQNDFVIPTSFLIGLGVGLLVDQVLSCILIGIGIGFLLTELVPLVKKSHEGEHILFDGVSVTNLLIGAFLTFIGICIVWAPAVIWPYSIAGLLILTGIGLLIRQFCEFS